MRFVYLPVSQLQCVAALQVHSVRTRGVKSQKALLWQMHAWSSSRHPTSRHTQPLHMTIQCPTLPSTLARPAYQSSALQHIDMHFQAKVALRSADHEVQPGL